MHCAFKQEAIVKTDNCFTISANYIFAHCIGYAHCLPWRDKKWPSPQVTHVCDCVGGVGVCV